MLHTQTMKNEVTYRSASVRQILSLALATALIVIAGGLVNPAAAQKLKSDKMNKFAPQGSKNDAANAKFQGGRDLISDEQWAKAIEMFNEYVSTYSKEQNIDAAMYWMAYSQVQLKKFDQAKETLNRLLKTYEKTTWKGDAQMLLAQLPNGMKINIDPITVTVDPVEVEVRSQELQDRIKAAQEREQDRAQEAQERAQAAREREQERVEAVLERMKEYRGVGIGVGVGSSDMAQNDDDPCEFKIVVLQALFQSDVQRGIAAATDWLKPGSAQTQRCKGAALGLLARHGGKAATPTILGVAKNESDPKLRARAISVLGATNDDSVVDALRDFAITSQDNDIAEAALYALSQHQSAQAVTAISEIAMSNKPVALRKVAISAIANRPGEPALDALFKIYDADQSLEIRKSVISGFGHRRSDRVGPKLLEIARGSDNIELRKAAISSISRRNAAGTIDTLLGLYDTEKNEELKDQIIYSLASSNDPRIVDKLIQIASNPQTPIERRRRAIGLLSRFKDPKVLKFLEDLLKQ
jgi:HEAT repeat protein/outer membrane protein assembly factor BamD (BamD/ComL family)